MKRDRLTKKTIESENERIQKNIYTHIKGLPPFFIFPKFTMGGKNTECVGVHGSLDKAVRIMWRHALNAL